MVLIYIFVIRGVGTKKESGRSNSNAKRDADLLESAGNAAAAALGRRDWMHYGGGGSLLRRVVPALDFGPRALARRGMRLADVGPM